uniref:Uncharacterized protein n=1 Tax=Myoviridae sp. ct7CH26 TaxID=2827604 RepID=A0A8S5RSM1_9CAUD|nr:MAG TPA: hypothetical protein [Myoviridae sp. ct7CH26]
MYKCKISDIVGHTCIAYRFSNANIMILSEISRCVARGISCLSRNRSLGAVSRRAESRVFALVTGWRSGRRNICGAYCSAI